MSNNLVLPHSFFTDYDIGLFKLGKHFRLYELLGSRETTVEKQEGVYFAVWAPNAKKVSVIGNFNDWKGESHNLYFRWDNSGIWEGFIPDITNGEVYKYAIEDHQGNMHFKGDPFAFRWERPPGTASIVSTTYFEWQDVNWMETRYQKNALNKPMSVYELHLGSWKKDFRKHEGWLNYIEIADELIPYVKEMGFTHVEFMPVMEHPYTLSWGYQITGYFAATSRFGSPQDLMYLIDKLHQNYIGVIFDWVPSHFPVDANGLYRFDGSALYEHQDDKQGFHPEWNSCIFNYGRNEVRSFLISNALFWLDRYHIDGFRVDAVTSMLYLDYARKEGEWIPNQYGGRENIEAINFLKELNEVIYKNYPDVQTIAEESSSWPMVTKPTSEGGLGFGMKWMMGWMNDSINYFQKDPIDRKNFQNLMTFGLMYAFSENYMLPLSHDEVVHGKSPMLYKMPGDEWQKFANLRALYFWQFMHPGTKLLFMGNEFGQTSEWNVSNELQWNLLAFEPHQGLKKFVHKLNQLYRSEPALYVKSFESEGFEWIDANDNENSVFVFERKGLSAEDSLVIVLNLTPIIRENYRIGFPYLGHWHVILNSDNQEFWGSDAGSKNAFADEIAWLSKPYSGTVLLPPLGGLVFKHQNAKKQVNSQSKEEEIFIL